MYRIFSWILLINLFWGIIGAQSVEQVYLLAEQLFNEKQYEAAIPLYNRIAFFSDSLRTHCMYRNGMCHLYLNNLPEAEQYLEFASQSAMDDSTRSIILMDKALLYLLSDQYGLAQLELNGINNTYRLKFIYQYKLLSGLSLMGQHKYEESLIQFEQILPSSHYYKLDSLIQIAIKWDKKKTGMAFYTSIFIPGSGQLFFGDIKESVNSLVLNSGLIALMYLVYREYGFLDATLSVLPWLSRYYLGGAIKAENLAIQKKQQIHRRIVYETILLLESDLKMVQ